MVKNDCNEVIEIPVQPYVKKVLLKWYKQEPLPLHQNNMMGKSLIALLADMPSQQTLIKPTIRGEKVRVQISIRLVPFYEMFENAFEMGFYFEKVVQHMMFTHVSAQVRCGVNALKALKDFYNLYGFDEDDYPFDTAYRMWQFNKRKFN